MAVNSGTSALHLLVRAFGIGEGDEVVTTPFSFIASSNCIYERARPVFVDVEADTGNVDPGLIGSAITPRTKAIIPVDAFGQPARLDIIRDMADRHGLVVIEDSCESLGSEYKGQKCGSPAYAHAAAFAFYPNKQITTGEGGMIVTDDPEVARLCRSMRNQGRGEAGVWLGCGFPTSAWATTTEWTSFPLRTKIPSRRPRLHRDHPLCHLRSGSPNS